MKSKKDQGNAHFKKQHFTQAIECYKQYVSIQNDDNCKAYSNMALSYFKLKQYENCIQACQRAVELQPQFEKPFYRMYQAYKQLNDLYGMVISASRFCRLSKEEKDVKAVEKQIVRVKEELRFRYMVRDNLQQQKQKDKKKVINSTNNVDNDKQVIASILALSNNPNKRQSQSITLNKQPQMCKQSKWQRIAQLAKHNKRQGLNAGIKFINQLSSQEQKEKYRRLYNKLKQLPLMQQQKKLAIKHNVDDDNNNKNEGRQQNKQSSSQQQQQLRIQQLQKYAEQQRKKKQQQTEHKRQKHQKQQQQQPHENQQRQQQQQKQQQKQQQQQQQQSKQQNLQQSTITITNINNQQQHPQHQQSQLITEQQSHLLFTQHISNLITKSQDPFTTFYQSLSNILKSSQLNKFQKQSILSQCPLNVKKFNMLMKSYSGKQKQQLQQLFVENNLHHIWQEKFVNLNNNVNASSNTNGNNNKK